MDIEVYQKVMAESISKRIRDEMTTGSINPTKEQLKEARNMFLEQMKPINDMAFREACFKIKVKIMPLHMGCIRLDATP